MGRGRRKATAADVPMPETLSAAIQYVHRRAIELGAQAQASVDDASIALAKQDALVCRAADLVGRLKLSAQLACAAGYVDWAEVCQATGPPERSDALSAWALAQCVRIVVRAERGDQLDVEAVAAALRFYLAAAKSEPDGAAIEAARELRGDRRAQRKEQGQPLSRASPRGPRALRI